MPESKDFEREVLDRLIKIEAKIESWESAKKQAYDNQREIHSLQQQVKQQQNDIDEMKEGNKWLKRTTAGAAIAAVVSTLIAIVLASLR